MRLRPTAGSLALVAVLGCGIASGPVTPGVAIPPEAPLICRHVPESALAEPADVVFEGAALSGPVSPARFYVLRYLKGHGPSTVRVGTQLGSSNILDQIGSALWFEPRPGETWRIYANVERGQHLLSPRVPCGGTRRITGPPLLHTAATAFAIPVGQRGPLRWRARALRGPHGLTCLRVDDVNINYREHGGACSVGRNRDSAVLAEVRDGYSNWASTAVAVAGRSIARLVVEGPDGRRSSVPVGRGQVAMVALPGLVAEHALAVTVVYRDGSERRLDDAARFAVAPDPAGQPPWVAKTLRLGDSHPLLTCVVVSHDPPRFHVPVDLGILSPRPSACGALVHARFFFAVTTTTPVIPSSAEPRPPTARTLICGAVRRPVTSLTVTGPAGPVQLQFTRGTFLGVLPADVDYRQLTVTARFSDGSSAVFRGRREANVAIR